MTAAKEVDATANTIASERINAISLTVFFINLLAPSKYWMRIWENILISNIVYYIS